MVKINVTLIWDIMLLYYFRIYFYYFSENENKNILIIYMIIEFKINFINLAIGILNFTIYYKG